MNKLNKPIIKKKILIMVISNYILSFIINNNYKETVIQIEIVYLTLVRKIY